MSAVGCCTALLPIQTRQICARVVLVLAAGRRWTPATTEESGNVEVVQQIEVVTVTSSGVLDRAGQVMISGPLSGAFTLSPQLLHLACT